MRGRGTFKHMWFGAQTALAKFSTRKGVHQATRPRLSRSPWNISQDWPLLTDSGQAPTASIPGHLQQTPSNETLTNRTRAHLFAKNVELRAKLNKQLSQAVSTTHKSRPPWDERVCNRYIMVLQKTACLFCSWSSGFGVELLSADMLIHTDG